MKHKDISIGVPWGHIAGRWYGNRNVRPIVALHGWQDNLGTWDRLIPLLPLHIGVLCVDFPGHGRSSRYPIGMCYHMVDYVDTISCILRKYKWEKISLLGHSMGGIICFIYAALYPQKVEMLIQLDILMTPLRDPNYTLQGLVRGTEKLLVENARLEELEAIEPPSYTYNELEEILYLGSNKSIEKKNCKYLLNRSINVSRMNTEKYYFSRDGRIKYYHEFNPSINLLQEMTKRLQNINHLVIKFTNSAYIDDQMLACVRKIHRKMVVEEVEGSHHAHLNNPMEVAAKIIPFISNVMPETKLYNIVSLSIDEIRSKL